MGENEVEVKLNYSDTPSRTIYEVIDWCRESSESEREKGDKFERAARYYLLNDPLWSARLEDVWLWKNAPTHDGADIGIDLVAKDAEDGTYWAIQCKCYDEDSTLDYKTVSTFYGATGNKDTYGHNMLISTTENLTNHLDKVASEWDTVRVFPSQMDEAALDWEPFLDGKAATQRKTFDPLPHQERAIADCIKGFEGNDRGKLIMACGTGKTLTSLRLAEEMLEAGSYILFLAPSISLVGQTMRAWANQARVPIRCAVVCSDAKASDAGVDAWESSLSDIPYPATTNPKALYDQMKEPLANGFNVVFSTYQSIQVVSDAQDLGLPPFDIIICDEAHRTTGAKDAGTSKQEQTEFVKVHDNSIVSGKKRLYMTATPRIYGETAKKKAKEEDYVISSMDDESIFGKEFHRLKFGEAVDEGLLTDYKVIALTVAEDAVSQIYQQAMANDEGFEIPDAAKIIGCWKGLAGEGDGGAGHALKNAVAFCTTIAESKRIQEYFKQIVDAYIKYEKEQENDTPLLHCDIEHVDGTMDSAERKAKLKWLAETEDATADGEEVCHILSNARCLAEGVDVPNLDAVMFLQPKKSEIDITQAVGRVMRKFEGKDYGYIILPIVIPAGMTAEEALDANEPFQVVWDIVKSLRSHDERLEARINALPYDKKDGDKKDDDVVTIIDVTPESDGDTEGDAPLDGDGEGVQMQMHFTEHELQEAVNAVIVKKCGSKVYWDDWAKDIGKIAQRHIERVGELVLDGGEASDEFQAFLKGLRDSLNEGISEKEAVEMLAQHMITLPIFDALFGGSEFAKSNPISIAMEGMVDTLREYNIETLEERRELDELYASVRRRAEGVKTDAGRQRIIKELYEKFFSQAFKATSEKMGIVYTPNEVVNYILHATNRLLQKEFGQSLADEGVNILDPFTGTGTFIVNLLQDEELMPLDKLPMKYKSEIWCNEILLLAYYIATINIEYAYHSRIHGEYAPFEGAVLTDTFQMYEKGDPLDLEMFVDNTERILREMETPIHVIVGNPPYSSGQKNADDSNQNTQYPTLIAKIRNTYAAKSINGSKKMALYDSYIEAFRWASDRIGERGVISFVTNGGWLDAQAMDGFRKCLVEEFSSIYVFNLRGNQRTQGEQSRKEGGKIFGSGSRAPITITMLVKNPSSEEHGTIHYHDIGDYLDRETKLAIVASSINGEGFEWDSIQPDRHGDWLNQRDESWYDFAPLGLSKLKAPRGIFELWSSGVITHRDTWMYSFSRDALVNQIETLASFFNEQIDKHGSAISSKDEVERIVEKEPAKIKWDKKLYDRVYESERIEPVDASITKSAYRPFCKEWLYYDDTINWSHYQLSKLFPTIEHENIYIAFTNGDKSSQLISNLVPDLHYVGDSQCFPLYWYEKKDSLGGMFADESEEYIRHDAITDEALEVFREVYPRAFDVHDKFKARTKANGGIELTKEDIFYYIYGILHSPEYRQRFEANLKKELPRIPLAANFRAFSLAGRRLAELHLNYESVEPYPLTVRGNEKNPGRVEKMKWGKCKDPETGKKVDDYTTLIYNENLAYSGIPEVANDYKVNGRSPLEWMIDRYQVKMDKASGIVNDPNDYSDDPTYISGLIPRLVTVAMDTMDIVNGLPPLNEKPQPADWPFAWKVSE
ncbi:DEAD/DEAH box helicase [Adlercreutzia agrestimuris]|uniref:DEAD/DEAH box helicase n=1 Tax=Adlercreutzia agrestimuris TaxID=2941324 RepID=UPI00204178D0|nr:type ISP restriction/modification enzyme [Adlercreutzia agrestimuris]